MSIVTQFTDYRNTLLCNTPLVPDMSWTSWHGVPHAVDAVCGPNGTTELLSV